MKFNIDTELKENSINSIKNIKKMKNIRELINIKDIRNKKKIIGILLIIVWMLFIFFMSSKTGAESKKNSKGIVYTAISVIENNKKEENRKSKKEIEVIVEKINVPLRKMAHITEYFILTLLILNVLKVNRKEKNKRIKLYIISVIIALLYAITDEIHQVFVEGRTGQVADVLIDSIGISIAITGYYIKTEKNKKGN